MKRWLLALLVLAAVIVFVSPGIVGHLAERQMQQNAEWANQENADVALTTESFDRGWFSSVGRHRLSLSGTDLAAKMGTAVGDEAPSIIFDTRVDHGILPFTSLSGDAGSLKPGLARTVSTMQLDPGDGELVPLPGKIFSEIGLSGETNGHYLLEPGNYQNPELAAEWDGARIEFLIKPEQALLSIEGEIQAFSMTSDEGTARFEAMVFSGEQVRTPFGFNVGTVKFQMGKLSVQDTQGNVTGISSFDIDVNTNLIDQRVNGRSRVQLGATALPNVGEVEIEMDVIASNMDAAALGKIAAAMQNARSSANPDQAMEELFPVIEADLQRLVTAGMEFRFDQLDVSLPQGDIASKISLELPPADAGADFSWPGVLLALRAGADMTVSATLVEMAQAMNPQAAALVQMGLLRQNGDNYEMQAEFASGLLSVNGVPMPIPMPGM